MSASQSMQQTRTILPQGGPDHLRPRFKSKWQPECHTLKVPITLSESEEERSTSQSSNISSKKACARRSDSNPDVIRGTVC